MYIWLPCYKPSCQGTWPFCLRWALVGKYFTVYACVFVTFFLSCIYVLSSIIPPSLNFSGSTLKYAAYAHNIKQWYLLCASLHSVSIELVVVFKWATKYSLCTLSPCHLPIWQTRVMLYCVSVVQDRTVELELLSCSTVTVQFPFDAVRL